MHTHTHLQVQRLAWHPSAANILASSGADPVILIWNTEESEPLFTLRSFTDMIFSFSWNYNGSHIAATCKDKKLRVYDVRKEAVVQVSDNKRELFFLKGLPCNWLFMQAWYLSE